ncbi:MAG: DoxX family protein [Patescibacteria group bacterium]
MNKELAVKITATLLRLVASLLLFQAGALKIFGWFGGMPAGYTLTPLLTTAGIIEIVGGVALFFGLFSRPVAFILSGEMAFAYFIGHFKFDAFWPIQNRGELAVILCFVFLFFAAYGAGEWSLDGMMKGRGRRS